MLLRNVCTIYVNDGFGGCILYSIGGRLIKGIEIWQREYAETVDPAAAAAATV